MAATPERFKRAREKAFASASRVVEKDRAKARKAAEGLVSFEVGEIVRLYLPSAVDNLSFLAPKYMQVMVCERIKDGAFARYRVLCENGFISGLWDGVKNLHSLPLAEHASFVFKSIDDAKARLQGKETTVGKETVRFRTDNTSCKCRARKSDGLRCAINTKCPCLQGGRPCNPGCHRQGGCCSNYTVCEQ